MSNTVVNSTDRRLSMFQFGGMFFVIVLLVCLTFYRSCMMHQELPKTELASLKEKEPMLKNLGELGDLLRKYEAAQKSSSPTVNSLVAGAKSKSILIHQQLAGKDTVRTFTDVKRTLEMADYYMAFIANSGQQTEQKVKQLEQQITDLKSQKTLLENKVQDLDSENKSLQQNLKSCQAILSSRSGGN
jgi:chromosome segregation ATPase